MVRKPKCEDLIDAIGERTADHAAIVRAVRWLPDRVYVEYLGKLNDSRQRPGTLHELRVVGKLLRAGSGHTALIPPKTDENFDAHLVVGETHLELEITAEIDPLFELSVRRVNERLKSLLVARYPGKGFHVRLAVDEGTLVISTNGALDENEAFDSYAAELTTAIDPSGEIADEFRVTPRPGLIASIEPSESTSVYQGSTVLPASVDAERSRRTVARKTRRQQWSGRSPAVLAVVLDHNPVPGVLGEGSPSVAGDTFATVPYLAAIVGVPYGNILATPVIFTPEHPVGLAVIPDDVMRELARRFRFWLGVRWQSAIVSARNVRSKMHARGEWPHRRGRRLF